MFWYHKTFESAESFRFRGVAYPYFYHIYGTTWRNERSVEIPIVWKIVNDTKDKNILEVGNVLSYRFRVYHDILDKYDKNEGVINEDVVHFSTQKRYDLIISISTLEHVGWDESPKDPSKILYAFENLKRLLSPGGRLIATLPLGYNPEMDRLLLNGDITFDERYCLKRIRKKRWQEARWEDVKGAQYDRSIPSANAIIVGIMIKEDHISS